MIWSTVRKEVAVRLRLLRTLEGRSQQNIADQLYIDRSTYSYYELGITIPSVEKLCKLAELFDVNIGYLVGKEELKSDHKYYNLLK